MQVSLLLWAVGEVAQLLQPAAACRGWQSQDVGECLGLGPSGQTYRVCGRAGLVRAE